MYVAYQPFAFQLYAYQTTETEAILNGWLGGYSHEWDRLKEQRYQERIKADREALERVELELESQEQKEAELRNDELKLNKLLEEIRKLRIERALLIQRIQEEEAMLIILMARRLRRWSI